MRDGRPDICLIFSGSTDVQTPAQTDSHHTPDGGDPDTIFFVSKTFPSCWPTIGLTHPVGLTDDILSGTRRMNRLCHRDKLQNPYTNDCNNMRRRSDNSRYMTMLVFSNFVGAATDCVCRSSCIPPCLGGLSTIRNDTTKMFLESTMKCKKA